MREGWETKKLGEVCVIIKRGISPIYSEELGLCVLNQKCIRNHQVNFTQARIHNSFKKIVNPERLLQVGDVVVNSTGTGTLGRLAQIRDALDFDCTVDSHITIVRPKQNLFFNDFFGYALIKIEEEITKSGEGASGQTELARTKLANDFQISFPTSLEEQKQIVGILDQSFEAIDQAKSNIQKNIENAKELFQNKRENFFYKAYELSKKNFNTLSNLCTIKTGKLNANAMVQDGEYPFFTCSRDIFRIDKYAFDTEAILLAGNNASGDFNVKHYKGKFNAYQRTYVITINNEDNLTYSFLKHKLDHNLQIFKRQSVGANTRFLKIGMINELEIPLPSVTIQNELCNNLDLVNDELNILISFYNDKINSLEELKKSILQKAFAGELTNKEEFRQVAEPSAIYGNK